MKQWKRQAVKLVKDLKENHGCTALKLEFEAEGTTEWDATTFNIIRRDAGVGLSVKIGGCEAVTDLRMANNLGATTIVAPMIETEYALRKYVEMLIRYESLNVSAFFNIETNTAIENMNMFRWVDRSLELGGVVIGRVDLCGSMGLGRNCVDSDNIRSKCKSVASFANENGWKVLVGGGISKYSNRFLQDIPNLYGFETRKVVFAASALNNINEAVSKALEFEILWLENKGYMTEIELERVQMLRCRV